MGNLGQIGKTLVVAGLVLALLGVLLVLGERSPLRLGRLPGDITLRGKHGAFYLPLMTCLVVSLVLSLMDRRADHGCLNPLFDGTADTDLIREQWDFLVRVAASLKNRTAPASVVVQRLANASSSDRLAGALTALGRVVKTILILRYLSDPELRHLVQLQLNRGEARHELVRRCLFFANRGEFRSGNAEGIVNKASCLSLLSNAVLVRNTLRIAEIVNQLRVADHAISNQDLARVSPLMHGHVTPNGTYRFSDEEEPRNMYAVAS